MLARAGHVQQQQEGRGQRARFASQRDRESGRDQRLGAEALEASAVDAFRYLVVTRVLACLIALPILTLDPNCVATMEMGDQADGSPDADRWDGVVLARFIAASAL